MSNVSTVPFADTFSAIFNSQKDTLQAVKDSTLADRLAHLQKFRSAVIEHKDAIVEAVYQDFQRAKAASYIIEVGQVINQIDYVIQQLPNWITNDAITPAAAPKDHPYHVEVMYEPKGVVLVVGPWNVPFYLTLYPLVYAIAAGNTVIVKPSELTPYTSAVIKKIIDQVFDPSLVAVVEGGVPEMTEILRYPFDHIYFTGSPKVAKIVMEAAAKHLTSVTLELGGKAPAILDTSADLDKAAYRIIKAKVLNAGQICMDVDYVLVPEELQSSLIAKMNAFLTNGYGESEAFDYKDYDQIINQPNFERVKRLYTDAVADGANVVWGGVFNEELRKIQPTILTNVSTESAIMKEEIFGPLLPIIAYKTKEEAIAIVNGIEKPLGLYVFSEDKAFTDYILQHTSSGGVAVNDVMIQAFDPGIPFGGVNNSGIGKGYGIHGFLELVNAKTILYQAADAPEEEFLKAPYDGKIDIIRPAFQ
ncbi:aldehyde dehydrogenase family protein [Sphingobacterium sp. LRF_L2]|uniref:aldehyde dehydrogenase family protein n=1 Tax=Sphingobacterium sp. LRF_L2 TaxID=3369421 RepID=UPI003F5FA3B8